MATDAAIPLQGVAPKFNTPFDALGQMQEIRLRQQQIATAKSLEDDRKQTLAKQQRLESEQAAVAQIISQPGISIDDAEQQIAQKVPNQLAAFRTERQKHEETAAKIAKDVADTSQSVASAQKSAAEAQTSAQTFVANDAQQTLALPPAMHGPVLNLKLQSYEKVFPHAGPVFDGIKQQLQAGADPTTILQGLVKASPQQQNADTTAQTAAAKLPGDTADSAIKQQVAAGTVGGMTPQQQSEAANQAATRAQEGQRIGLETRRVANETANADAAPTLTKDALDITAHQFAMTGNLPPMGMGKQGAAVRTAIINRAADIYKGLDLPQQAAAYKANQQSLVKMQGQRDAVGSFEETALKNLDQFLGTASKVVDTGSPLVNKPLRTISGQLLGSPEMAAYKAARQTVLPEFSRILGNPNLSGQITDSQRKEMSDLISGDASLAQIYATAKILKQDAANRRTSLDDAIKGITDRIANPPKGVTAAPAPAAAGQVEEWVIDPKSGKLVKKS